MKFILIPLLILAPYDWGTVFSVQLKLTKADIQATPLDSINELLRILNPQPDEVLLDPGCGYDARLLIIACQNYGVRSAIGIEIDPEVAESARRYVAKAGLSDKITIITGDSTQVNVNADIGVAYMWPDVLRQLKPKIEKLNRFASYEYSVPELSMSKTELSNGGKVYFYQQVKAVRPVYKTVNGGIQMLPRGSMCEICGRRCASPMAHRAQQVIVGYE